jgi:hypothetical protein
MGIPLEAIVWKQPFDPLDRLDYLARFDDLIAADEVIHSFEATVLSAGADVGLGILEGEIEGENFGPFIANDKFILVHFEVAEEMRADPAFLDNGTRLPVRFVIWTNSSPRRRFKRTFVLQGREL